MTRSLELIGSAVTFFSKHGTLLSFTIAFPRLRVHFLFVFLLATRTLHYTAMHPRRTRGHIYSLEVQSFVRVAGVEFRVVALAVFM